MICFSKEALTRLTNAQITKLCDINARSIDVSVDFSLPNGYIYVIIEYNVDGPTIHGGISSEGEMST